MPNVAPRSGIPPAFDLPATAEDIKRFLYRFIPYRQGAHDIHAPNPLSLGRDRPGRADLVRGKPCRLGPGPSPNLPVFAALAQGVAERND